MSKKTRAKKRGSKKRRVTARRWIRAAVGSPSALHVMLHVPQGQIIPRALLEEASKDHGLLGKRARLAKTLAALRREIRSK